MSFQGRKELLARVAPRYKEANKKQNSLILNEFITSTGYARKYAIRLLSSPVIEIKKKIKRPRERFYEEKVPGFFEADLVAHCGWSMEGSFLYTLVLTDVATG